MNIRKILIFLCLGIVISFISVVLLFWTQFHNFKNLKKSQKEVHDDIGETISKYYREYLVPPESIDSLNNYCKSENYGGLQLLGDFIHESRICLTQDSIFLFFNNEPTDSVLDNPIDIQNASFFDYRFGSSDIIVFKWRKLDYCDFEITSPHFLRNGLFFSDSTIFPDFYRRFWNAIGDQYPSDVTDINFDEKVMIIIESSFLGDSIVIDTVKYCGDFPGKSHLNDIIKQVLTKTEISNKGYEKSIIPILISPSALSFDE